MEEAAAQECIRQFFLVVAGDEDHRAVASLHQLARLVDVEIHAIELAQQVVRKLDVGLVDFVDEQHWLDLRLERFPQAALHDVVADLAHFLFAELRVAQARDGVVLVQSLLCLARGLDVPLVERPLERARDLQGELRLPRAGLALDEQWTSKRDRGVHRHQRSGVAT
jgi:hypothetical protein